MYLFHYFHIIIYIDIFQFIELLDETLGYIIKYTVVVFC